MSDLCDEHATSEELLRNAQSRDDKGGNSKTAVSSQKE